MQETATQDEIGVELLGLGEDVSQYNILMGNANTVTCRLVQTVSRKRHSVGSSILIS